MIIDTNISDTYCINMCSCKARWSCFISKVFCKSKIYDFVNNLETTIKGLLWWKLGTFSKKLSILQSNITRILFFITEDTYLFKGDAISHLYWGWQCSYRILKRIIATTFRGIIFMALCHVVTCLFALLLQPR